MATELNPLYKTQIYLHIKDKLYGQGQHFINMARSKIARHNGNLPFYYDNFKYSITGIECSGTFSNEYTTELPKEFIPRMEEILHEEIELNNEEHIVMTFVRQALNIGDTIADFRELLPSILYDYFPKVDQKYLEAAGHLKVEIDSAEILAFTNKNKHISDIIKNRLMTNLILKDL